MDAGQVLGFALGALCAAFGLFALQREWRKYRSLDDQAGGMFDSKRRSSRRILCSSLLLGTGLLLVLGLSFQDFFNTPLRLLLYCMALAISCVAIGFLVCLDVVETGRTLSRHTDKMVEETTQALEEIARISRARRKGPTDQ